MIDKPILFSGPMVRAIFDDRKTNTRRVIKNCPECGIQPCHFSKTGWAIKDRDGTCSCTPFPCSYHIGTKLWVRETHGFADSGGALVDPCLTYRADNKQVPIIKGTDFFKEYEEWYFQSNGYTSGKWRPSIFMPKWAARLWLEVIGVRVERLQEILNEDAKYEGVCGVDWGYGLDYGGPANYLKPFQKLWDSINGKKYPWSSNPYVWAIEFKRIK